LRAAGTAALVKAVLLVLAGAAVATATAAQHADPGITPQTILLGATAPLTGPESASAAVVRGAGAYFRYVNARGGVNGRTIAYEVVDDAADPEQAVQATLRLVDEDGVFAIVNSSGTEQNLATRPYLNAAKVPQLFVGSGATAFGTEYRRYPSTIGFQPSHRTEGWIYGRYVSRSRPAAKLAVLYEDGADGLDLLAGLKQGITRSKARVVVAEPVDPLAPDVETQVASLKASGASVLALFVSSEIASQAYAAANRLGWRPLIVGRPASKVEGAVSIAFLKDPTDAAWRDDPALKLYRTIMARYAKGANALDVGHVHGMAVAYETVRVLKAAGETPTRAAVVARTRKLNDASNPFLLPGIVIRTTATDHFPIEQALLQRWSKGRRTSFGGLWG
jgi:ABC-type branched-subunit amino acid transport system substrate-binding protein